MPRPPRKAVHLPPPVDAKLDQVIALHGGKKTNWIIQAVDELADRKLAEHRETLAEQLLLSRKGESE